MEKDFHHPYQPYNIQKQFMTAIYDCIEDAKVGIFESPTGTGKSLSLICGSLTWLREHKRRQFEESLDEPGDDDEPDWIVDQARNAKRETARREITAFKERLAKARKTERKTRQTHENGEPLQKRQKTTANQDVDPEAEATFELDNYESDDDARQGIKSSLHSSSDLSAETQALMERLGMSIAGDAATGLNDATDELKIFYCSRTHSQLTQFSNELRRVRLPPVLPPLDSLAGSPPPNRSEGMEEGLKHLTLGSRTSLCINTKVNRLANVTAINEKCLELQQAGTPADHRCPYLPTQDNETLVHDFRDNVLDKVRDIEDLGSLGKKLGICPYYASRPTIRPSEIVTLPYPLLLQKSARQALDLSLKNHVIIIDEAHNLMDAITGIYSVSISLKQLQASRAQLGVYLQKFRHRLKGKNRVYLAQIMRLVNSLIQFLQSRGTNNSSLEGTVEPSELMASKGADQINLYKLVRYLQVSKLARKVEGYLVHAEEHDQPTTLKAADRSKKASAKETAVPVLTQIQGFLVALMNPSSEGRFFFGNEESGMTLRYMLLDPAHHFREIVEDARAVILAGGTMSPMSDYYDHLFPYLPPTRIQTLSCGHVIPPSNLLAMPINEATSGTEFDFTFEKRNSEAMIRDVGEAILSVIENTPDGVVVFFPSYAYLSRVVSIWRKVPDRSTSDLSLWDRITNTKPTFLEPRATTPNTSDSSNPQNTARSSRPPPADSSSAPDSTLTSYAAAIAANNGKGALLLSVIGGSLSEGINFSDALGRCVIVIGLPFPNPHTAEWKAKAAYAESMAKGKVAVDPKAASREFYENVCMRAVNQCVGRAIRHKGDYAAILLMDKRYGNPRIREKLPGWIKESLRGPGGVRAAVGALKEFFRGKEEMRD
ncbi:ATP-dependent RNA helicase-like protein chl1 [Viridothelium virens]|uniref:ATP-dependent DNA helicase CHL1 n=1 Tax=Viridothelium virens TaxID=1048519 RepID=A0A6A6H481_VIRVR|nr:ATP-dependent RNA helicase-like protein chl1 [Viridothelium virens]